ncbi:MAG TPA: amidohydrolase family protein, partial [Pirellulaceae bacterium]|nr:amidohydrolase family protein [Pirellulaceae bacterium]
MIKVDEHLLERAKFPVVDTHTHFRIRTRHSPEQRDGLVEMMDRNNIAICVSLDGGWGDAFDEHSAYLWTKYRDRFVIFANIDWRGAGREDDPSTWDCLREDFPRRAAERLADAKRRGASGVKIFKEFGLGYKNADGSLIKVDDPRWDEIWRACGELGLPVLMHTGDPSAFFTPIDPTNERWEELSRRPEWSFADRSKFPSRDELFAARNKVVERHPKTQFIAAHFGNDGEDFKTLAAWLDRYPNLHVDLASRISELGRQPYSSRRFITKYADRVLFATDGPWPEQRVRLYWRFLETFDENFPYSEKDFPPQGLWNIYGIGLDDEVLKKVYHENAGRLIPGVAERLAKLTTKTAKSAEAAKS